MEEKLTLEEIKRRGNRAKTNAIVSKIILTIIVILGCFIILFPIIWMIPGAFKTKQELWGIPNTWWPRNFVKGNFIKIFETDYNGYNFKLSVIVTFVVAVATVILNLTINLFAAFSFSTMNYRGKKALWIYYIFTMFIPGITILLTSLRVVSILNMVDKIWVLIIPGLANAYNIFFFRQFFFGIPVALEEAAMIDGCSRFKIFWKIFIPMSSTPMVIIGINAFMGAWNSYIWPTLTIIDHTEYAQIYQVVRVLSSSSYAGTNYSIIVAATEVAILIPLTLFIIFQKKIVAGISISGLK